MDAGKQVMNEFDRKQSILASSRGSSISEAGGPKPILKKLRENRAKPRVSFFAGGKDPIGTGLNHSVVFLITNVFIK